VLALSTCDGVRARAKHVWRCACERASALVQAIAIAAGGTQLMSIIPLVHSLVIIAAMLVRRQFFTRTTLCPHASPYRSRFLVCFWFVFGEGNAAYYCCMPVVPVVACSHLVFLRLLRLALSQVAELAGYFCLVRLTCLSSIVKFLWVSSSLRCVVPNSRCSCLRCVVPSSRCSCFSTGGHLFFNGWPRRTPMR
jgi:hypothetical protein